LSLTPMTAALTPALALDYLHALSADLRAAVVLDARGECLAGPSALGEAARTVLASPAGAEPGPDATLFEGVAEAGSVFAARDDRHTIVAVTGSHALSRLSRHDLRSALVALGGVNVVDGPPNRLSPPAVNALLGAVDDGFRRPRAV
jgi:hypothetical protein